MERDPLRRCASVRRIGITIVSVVHAPELDGDDLHVVSGEIHLPFRSRGNALGKAQVEVADGELAGLAEGAVAVDNMGRVVAARVEAPLVQAGAVQRDLLHHAALPPDHQCLRTAPVAVHDVESDGVSFLVGHPVTEIEQEGPVDGRLGGIGPIVGKTEGIGAVAPTPRVAVGDAEEPLVLRREMRIEFGRAAFPDQRSVVGGQLSSTRTETTRPAASRVTAVTIST